MAARIVAFLFFYSALTLGAALIAHPSKNDLLGISRKAAPLADALPGAAIWPRLLDLDVQVMGQPLALIIMGALIVIMGALLTYARAQSKRRARDREVERDEMIRMHVRRDHESHR